MTRQFNQQVHCPNCKTWITHETSFGRWIRNNQKLNSGFGYAITDQDYWVHKFKTYSDPKHGDRDFQLIMLVEIKTMGIPLSESQSDTLHIVNQLMRNRKQTPTKDLAWQAGYSQTIRVDSLLNKRKVTVRAYGMHVLTFSGLGPDDSESIKWDRRTISLDMLTSLLAFDLDPDTLQPLDLRNHHRAPRLLSLQFE